MPTLPPPRISQPPAGDDDASEAPLVVRFGTLVGAAVIASALASGPAALRVSSPETGAPAAWPALAAAALLPMFVAIFLLRRARVGFRAFAGAAPTLRMLALSFWALTLGAISLALGAVLRATTHHHALAGVTFALASLAAAALLALVCARVASIARAAIDANRPGRVVAGAIVALALVAFAIARVGRGGPALSPTGAANVVDLLAFAMAALFASGPELLNRRSLALFGPPVAAGLLALGLSTLRASTTLSSAIRDRAPTFATAAGSLLD